MFAPVPQAVMTTHFPQIWTRVLVTVPDTQNRTRGCICSCRDPEVFQSPCKCSYSGTEGIWGHGGACPQHKCRNEYFPVTTVYRNKPGHILPWNDILKSKSKILCSQLSIELLGALGEGLFLSSPLPQDDPCIRPQEMPGLMGCKRQNLAEEFSPVGTIPRPDLDSGELFCISRA